MIWPSSTAYLPSLADQGQFTDPFLLSWQGIGLPNGTPNAYSQYENHNLDRTLPVHPLGPSDSDAMENMVKSLPAASQYEIPKWAERLSPNIRHFDSHIINYFLNMCVMNLGSSLATFKDFSVTAKSLPDVVLSMAAVGGLFSRLNGSFRIAQAMYTDARRLLLGRVRNLVPHIFALSSDSM